MCNDASDLDNVERQLSALVDEEKRLRPKIKLAVKTIESIRASLSLAEVSLDTRLEEHGVLLESIQSKRNVLQEAGRHTAGPIPTPYPPSALPDYTRARAVKKPPIKRASRETRRAAVVNQGQNEKGKWAKKYATDEEKRAAKRERDRKRRALNKLAAEEADKTSSTAASTPGAPAPLDAAAIIQDMVERGVEFVHPKYNVFFVQAPEDMGQEGPTEAGKPAEAESEGSENAPTAEAEKAASVDIRNAPDAADENQVEENDLRQDAVDAEPSTSTAHPSTEVQRRGEASTSASTATTARVQKDSVCHRCGDANTAFRPPTKPTVPNVDMKRRKWLACARCSRAAHYRCLTGEEQKSAHAYMCNECRSK